MRRSAEDSCDIEIIAYRQRFSRVPHVKAHSLVLASCCRDKRDNCHVRAQKACGKVRERMVDIPRALRRRDNTGCRMYHITNHLCSFARVCTIISRRDLSRCLIAVGWSSCLSGVGSAKQNAKAGPGEVSPSVSPDMGKLLIKI